MTLHNADKPVAACELLDDNLFTLLFEHRNELRLTVPEGRRLSSLYGGITKREHIATQALQGMLANPNNIMHTGETMARDAVIMADQLLKALEIRYVIK